MRRKNECVEILRDLREFGGTRKPAHVLEYPLVVRKVLENMTVSVPDLSIWTTFPLPPKVKTEKGYVTQFNDEYALHLGREILRTYSRAAKHMHEKKWVPNASDIKAVVMKQDKPLSVPAFTRLIAQVLKVSQDTIRRDIDAGIIKCKRTTGGHRRIPASEVGRYVDQFETNHKLGKRRKNIEEALQLIKKCSPISVGPRGDL